MKKLLRYTTYVLPLVVLASASFVFAVDPAPSDYLLVDDLPFINNTANLNGYLNGLFKLGIGLAVTLAIVMLVIGGMQYMVSDVPNVKMNAKGTIQNALWGLLLVLDTWLILNTINPDLVDFKLLNSLQQAVDSVEAPATGTGGGGEGGVCNNCAPLPKTNPPLSITASCGSSCQLNADLIGKIESLNRTLVERNVGWKITEAYPSDNVHRDGSCHDTGSCFDANIQSTTDVNIIVFQDAASSVGLRAVYEVKTNDEALRLRNIGVNPVIFNPNASAPHFHIN